MKKIKKVLWIIVIIIFCIIYLVALLFGRCGTPYQSDLGDGYVVVYSKDPPCHYRYKLLYNNNVVFTGAVRVELKTNTIDKHKRVLDVAKDTKNTIMEHNVMRR